MLTLQALIHIEGHGLTGGTIWNDATGTLTPSKEPDTMLNRIALSIQLRESAHPLQVVK